MADHKSFTIATNVKVYFCDPRSPWQRGSNENTNGLLRQCFPHGTDLSRFSQANLNKIALRLNQRPRKTLGFETPADRLKPPSKADKGRIEIPQCSRPSRGNKSRDIRVCLGSSPSLAARRAACSVGTRRCLWVCMMHAR